MDNRFRHGHVHEHEHENWGKCVMCPCDVGHLDTLLKDAGFASRWVLSNRGVIQLSSHAVCHLLRKDMEELFPPLRHNSVV